MKIILVGARGTIGRHVGEALAGHEIVPAGRAELDVADAKSVAAFYARVGGFDAVANASGSVAFAPFAQLSGEQWDASLRSKLLGQINLVREALPFIREGGSFTLVSGVLSNAFIAAGVAASTINRAVEGFAQSVAPELPRRLRINVVSPTLLEDSRAKYGAAFPGFEPVSGARVALAYVRSILGIETGRVYRVGE